MDRIYMIMNFPNELQDALKKDKSKAKTDTSKASKESFDEMMTRWINVQEHKISKNNTLVSLVINSDFATSCIITAP